VDVRTSRHEKGSEEIEVIVRRLPTILAFLLCLSDIASAELTKQEIQLHVPYITKNIRG